MKKTLTPLLFLACGILALSSCEKKQQRAAPWATETEEKTSETDAPEEEACEDMLADSAPEGLAPQNLSKDEVADELTQLLQQIEQVKSPDLLLAHIADLQHQLAQCEADAKQSKDAALQAKLSEAKQAYSTMLQDYRMPANSLISTIKRLQKQLDDCHTAQEFDRITSARRSYFRHLADLHLIAAEPQEQRQVRQLAKQLSDTYKDKQRQFSKK